MSAERRARRRGPWGMEGRSRPPLFIEAIHHTGRDGSGYAQREQRLREARAAGREFHIEAGKRAEFEIDPGKRAIVHILEGSLRFEGDDTAALAGDTVCFRPAPPEETAMLGVEADTPVRGILVAASPQRMRPFP